MGKKKNKSMKGRQFIRLLDRETHNYLWIDPDSISGVANDPPLGSVILCSHGALYSSLSPEEVLKTMGFLPPERSARFDVN